MWPRVVHRGRPPNPRLLVGLNEITLVAVSPATVQRLLGKKAGRLAADRARGIDSRPVVPRPLPYTTASPTTLDGATFGPPCSTSSSGSASDCAAATKPSAP
ncbi:hypothetical protein AB0F30_34865 [Streptomyces sp. NPDC029006]|uniref:hypothetical protein n=1 Tax=Streptomyces sp. NPDC029006 TaxID=3155467 RepID=UPI00340B12DA